MKIIQILSIISLLVVDIYLWLSTDIDPECSQIDSSSIWLAMCLQALWIFLVLKPDYLLDMLSMILKPRFPQYAEAQITRWAKYLIIFVLLVFAYFIILMLWEGLRGGTYTGLGGSLKACIS